MIKNSRQPMYLISLYTGKRTEDNPMGLVPEWNAPDGVDWLLDQIRKGYSYGARRFFINRPMGSDGITHVPGGSWLTVDKRQELAADLTDALLDELHEPVHITWFVGSDTKDPRDTAGRPREDSIENPLDSFYMIGSTGTWDQLVATRTTLGGWISTGASGIAIDHSANPKELTALLELHDSLKVSPFEIEIMGEAYPLTGEKDDQERWVIDQDAITRMPFVITLSNFLSQRWDQDFDPRTTSLHVWIDYSPAKLGSENNREMFARNLHNRGLITVTSDRVMFAEAMRLFHKDET